MTERGYLFVIFADQWLLIFSSPWVINLLTYLLTYLLMELRASSEAANCAATQEIPSVLWNPKVHYRLHKSPPLVPILSQIDPMPTLPSYLSKINFKPCIPSKINYPTVTAKAGALSQKGSQIDCLITLSSYGITLRWEFYLRRRHDVT
jgi:hypothetical protein